MMILIFIFAFCSIVSPTSFTLTNFGVSPATAKSSSSSYNFQFNTVSAFTTDFDLHITFPTAQYTMTAVSACQLSINDIVKTSATCSVSPSTN